MAELSPIRGAKYPIGTTYVSPRFDEKHLLTRYGNFHKKLARVKHLLRNNSACKAAVGAMVTHVASNGITPVGADSIRLAIWNGWTKRADMAQTKSYSRVVSEMVDGMCSGDILVVLRSKKKPSENRVSSFIDLVNGGRVATPSDFADGKNPKTGNIVTLGCEYDEDGVEIGYWVVQNPLFTDSNSFVFVPRYNPETGRFVSLLLRNPDATANSVRGPSLIDAVIPDIEDFGSLLDSGVQAGIVKNTLAVGIETPTPKAAYDAMQAVDASGEMKEDVDPSTNELVNIGNVPYGSAFTVAPGAKMHLISHSGNIDMVALLQHVKHNFSAGVNIPYEIIFGDYSGVNFSAGKLLHDPFWRKRQKWTEAIAELTQEIYVAVTDEGLLIRGLVPAAYSRQVSYWVGSNRTEADEGKATNAAVLKISSGLMPTSKHYAERGEDYEAALKQYAEDIALEKKYLPFGSVTEALLKSSAQNKHLVLVEDEQGTPV